MKAKRGIVKLLIAIIIALAALTYFRVDLRSWIESIIDWWKSQDLPWLKEQFALLRSQLGALFDRLR